MVGPSVFTESQGMAERLVLQYLVGPSVFPDSRLIPEWLVLQYFQVHESYHAKSQIHASKNKVLKPKIDFLVLILSPKRLRNDF